MAIIHRSKGAMMPRKRFFLSSPSLDVNSRSVATTTVHSSGERSSEDRTHVLVLLFYVSGEMEAVTSLSEGGREGGMREMYECLIPLHTDLPLSQIAASASVPPLLSSHPFPGAWSNILNVNRFPHPFEVI